MQKDSLCALARWFCISRKGETGRGGWDREGRWGPPQGDQGDMHMVADRPGFETAMVGTGGAPPPPPPAFVTFSVTVLGHIYFQTKECPFWKKIWCIKNENPNIQQNEPPAEEVHSENRALIAP